MTQYSWLPSLCPMKTLSAYSESSVLVQAYKPPYNSQMDRLTCRDDYVQLIKKIASRLLNIVITSNTKTNQLLLTPLRHKTYSLKTKRRSDCVRCGHKE